jgi:hypothetical protein
VQDATPSLGIKLACGKEIVFTGSLSQASRELRGASRYQEIYSLSVNATVPVTSPRLPRHSEEGCYGINQDTHR